MKYTRLYTDADGVARFEDVDAPLSALTGYVQSGDTGGAPTIHLSAAQTAASVSFARFPAGWFADWHPAPRRQFMTCLSGEWETTDGTQQKRHFKQGDVLLLEDTTGIGHYTRVLQDTVVQITVVPSS